MAQESRPNPPMTREEYEKLFPEFVKKFPDGAYGPSVPTPKPLNEPSVPNPPQNTESTATRGAPQPIKKRMSEIKSKLLNPALTSHFQCWFNPPISVRDYIAAKGFNYNLPENSELISLSCSDASLPGSSLATNELTDDFTGVTERHAYRRLFDNTADFTFYVDHARKEGSYNLIWFFEAWIAFIAGDGDFGPPTLGSPRKEFSYRNRYPNSYQSQSLYLQKFEKDYAETYSTIGSEQYPRGSYLQYQFLNAFPTSINSMPVSYESSQLLKVTVTFTYSRYILSRNNYTYPTNKEIERAVGRGVDGAVEALGDIGTQLGREIAQDLLSRPNTVSTTSATQPRSNEPGQRFNRELANSSRRSSRVLGTDAGRTIRGL